MSIAIDTDRITDVLLADGWHMVAGESFDLDSYEYVCEEQLVHAGGRDRLITATGFTFTDDTGAQISGPLTAILAVREP